MTRRRRRDFTPLRTSVTTPTNNISMYLYARMFLCSRTVVFTGICRASERGGSRGSYPGARAQKFKYTYEGTSMVV